MFIQTIGWPVTVTQLQKTFAGIELVSAFHQMIKQQQTQATALIFWFDGDVEQMRFIDDDLNHTMAHLLCTFEHQPDFVGFEPVEEDPACPRVGKRRVFDFQYRVQIGLGHAAEGYGVTHQSISSASSADAWLSRRQPCVAARPSLIPGPAAPGSSQTFDLKFQIVRLGIHLTGVFHRRQTDQPQAGARFVFQPCADKTLHEITRGFRPLIHLPRTSNGQRTGSPMIWRAVGQPAARSMSLSSK